MKKNLLHRWCSKLRARKETSGPDWVEVSAGPLRGHSLFLASKSSASWNREMMEGGYDSFFFQAIRKLGGIESSTIWDVGAHIGYHSLAFASLVGLSGRVVAFEPNPYNLARFRKNLEKNPALAQRVTTFNYALSDSDGEETFIFSPEVDNGRSSGSHLDRIIPPENANAYRSFAQIQVRTIKADTMILDNLAPIPSAIKIDVEGAEQAVLKGSSELLLSEKPILFIEIHNIAMMFNVQKFLYRYGYEMSMIQTEHNSSSRGFFVAKHPGRKSD